MAGMVELLLLALGLSVDAMAAATTIGLCKVDLRARDGLRVGAYFGGFQALMPLLGYLLGSQFRRYVQPFDHWLILGLLLFVGGKMIWEARQFSDTDNISDPCSHWRLFILAIATSLDALAAGISLSLSQAPMLRSVLIIGLVTFLLSFAGAMWGRLLGKRFRSLASITGGVILILIGLKVVVEHLSQGI
ncbi:MAG: manganese efflux pump MntP family protein [Saccharofermentanales bacterium]|jgi:putative Mn2+ efflux pump MntP